MSIWMIEYLDDGEWLPYLRGVFADKADALTTEKRMARPSMKTRVKEYVRKG